MKGIDQRSLPRVVSGLASGLFEGSHVEAGDVGLGPVGRSECSVGGAMVSHSVDAKAASAEDIVAVPCRQHDAN